MRIFRGDVYYIKRIPTTGCEQQAGRPAVIVSNNLNNKHSSTVEVVYLTTKPKTDLPTHVRIITTGIPSTVLCEQVHTIDVTRLGDFCGKCSNEEIKNIDEALMISLNLNAEKKGIKSAVEEANNHGNELTVANAQLTLIQQLYSDLLRKSLKSDLK